MMLTLVTRPWAQNLMLYELMPCPSQVLQTVPPDNRYRPVPNNFLLPRAMVKWFVEWEANGVPEDIRK